MAAILKVKQGSEWTDIPAIVGRKGDPGPKGNPGDDGFSPTITVTDITGGHRVTITDATGPHSFDVMDGEGAVQDVQVNGTSVVSGGVANVPLASAIQVGAVYASAPVGGIAVATDGLLKLATPSLSELKALKDNKKTAMLSGMHTVAFYALAKAAGANMASLSGTTVGIYPEAQKSAIHEMLNGSVSVTGTTPTITALPGIRYVCGEVATLDITLPASGCIDVVFESGSTPTVLTVTPPTGVTVKWANSFDPTVLEANTTYEINIADGLGVAVGWT